MDVLVARSERTGQERRVVVPSRVIAALSQLESTEQAAVRQTFQTLGHAGIRSGSGMTAKKLDAPGALFALYLEAAPDVLVLARACPDASVEIVDLVRPATLQSLFHTA